MLGLKLNHVNVQNDDMFGSLEVNLEQKVIKKYR